MQKLEKNFLRRYLILSKGQGTSGRAGYFLAGYGCFPYPDVPGLVQKDPDIRKFNLHQNEGFKYRRKGSRTIDDKNRDTKYQHILQCYGISFYLCL